MIGTMELKGIDGANPLGFLAALGVFRAAADAREQTRLSWSEEFHPRLEHWDPAQADTLIKVTCEAIRAACELLSEENYPSTIPSLELQAARRFLIKNLQLNNQMGLDFCSCLFAEGAPFLWEPKPAQKKAGMIAELRAEGTRLCHADNPAGKRLIGMFRQFADIDVHPLKRAEPSRGLSFFIKEIFEQWKYHAPEEYKGKPRFPAFRWDPSENRPGAYEAEAPESDNLASVPGANALSLLGLTLFATVPSNGRAISACVYENHTRVNGFVWPLWSPPLSLIAVKSLLSHGSVWLDDRRKMRGIRSVFRSKMSTTDNGSHFFDPAEAL